MRRAACAGVVVVARRGAVVDNLTPLIAGAARMVMACIVVVVVRRAGECRASGDGVGFPSLGGFVFVFVFGGGLATNHDQARRFTC